MPIELRTRPDLSINDIVRLTSSHIVRVTPHVGNWTPARLVLPTLQLSILCVDHTIGERDPNAHPHLLIRNGRAFTLCDKPDRLTTHSYVTQVVDGSVHKPGVSLTDVHIGVIRALYPGADIVTHVEHLNASRDMTLAVLEEATALSPSGTWWRRVDEEGKVTCYRKKDLPTRWSEYESCIFPLTNPREGWLVHNRVAILMDVIDQSRMGTEPEIYHLSGPDMVRYLGNEIGMISRMYDQVRGRLGLPRNEIVFNLVPFASFRFATRASQTQACKQLCTALADGCPDEKRIRSYAAEASDVFCRTETQDHFSQHDLLATGEAIVVTEIAREWSMDTCAAHLERVRAL